MKRLPFRQGVVLALALAVLAAVALALWLGVFRHERAGASPGVDLVITKTASPSEGTLVVTGGTITYTLTASNIGDTAATDVVIRDWVGTGLSLALITGGAGVTCTDNTGPEYDCTADIAAGASRTVTIVVTVTAASGSFVYNGAYVDPDDDYPAENNDDADDPDHDCSAVGEGTPGGTTEPDNYDCTRHAVGTADLTITKVASLAEGTVAPGSTITYTLTASNAATATGTATNVGIRDYVGAGLTFVSATPGAGVTCPDITPPINCTVASLAPAQSRTVTIVVTVAASSGPVLNGAYVDPDNAIDETNEDADDPDLNCAAVGEGGDAGGATEDDNFDCTSHTAVALPDLVITKTASPSETTTVATGDTVTYTLTVSNSAAATGTASNVPIRDTIGTGVTLTSVTPGTGVTCDDTSAPEINCVAASIAPGASRTVTIVVTVSATSGTVLNGARVDPGNAITEINEDADDPTLDCAAVGEGTDAGSATEADNYDCTSHSLEAATPTPTPTPGVLTNCPLSGKWAMSVWDGPSGTATADALATCTGVTIDAAYSLDRTTNQWRHYFPGRTDINNLLTLDDMQAIFTLAR